VTAELSTREGVFLIFPSYFIPRRAGASERQHWIKAQATLAL
jgi:hypothetical protein